MTHRALLITSLFLVSSAASGLSPGTWSGKTAGSAGTTSGTGAAGAIRGSGTTTGGSGTPVSVSVSSWTTAAEADELAKLLQSGDTKGFLAALNGYDHGSVTIGSTRVPVDFAWSGTAGGKSVVVVASAKPFSASGARGGASGAAVGYLRLVLDSSEQGEGAMYSTTQVAFQGASGELVARAGASSATKLVDISR